MAEVGGADDYVVADGLNQRRDSGIVLVGGYEALALEIVHGVAVQPLDSQPPGSSLYARFQPVQPEGGPAAARFQEHQLQVGVPFQHSSHDEAGTGQHTTHNEGHRSAAVSQAGEVVQQPLVEGVVGAGVQSDGNPQLGAGRPQHIALRVEQAQVGNGRGIQMHRLEVVLADTPAHFLGGQGRVAQVYGSGSAGPLPDFLAVVAQPAIVSPPDGHGGLAVHLGNARGPEPGGRVENHVVHAVNVHHLPVGAGGKVLVGPPSISHVQLVQVAVLEAASGCVGVPGTQWMGAHYLQLQLEGQRSIAC